MKLFPPALAASLSEYKEPARWEGLHPCAVKLLIFSALIFTNPIPSYCQSFGRKWLDFKEYELKLTTTALAEMTSAKEEFLTRPDSLSFQNFPTNLSRLSDQSKAIPPYRNFEVEGDQAAAIDLSTYSVRLYQLNRVDEQKTCIVARDDKEVFRLDVPKDPLGQELRAFFLNNQRWVLEISGDVFIDGESLKKKENLNKVFFYRILGSKPFFFFQDSHGFGLSFAGKKLSKKFDQIIHDECCDSSFYNPIGNDHEIIFFARRKSEWYLMRATLK